MRPGVFITGTDTGVGKTHFACRLLLELRQRGLRPSPFKPIETGGDEDARALRDAAAVSDLSLDAIAPYRLRTPATPAAAAEMDGLTIDVDRIIRAFGALSGDVVVAEGAGGLLVPVTASVLLVDLVARLELPLLVVTRARLGTINHTLLTVSEIRRRGLPLLGVVLNSFQADSLDHARWIGAFGGRLLGTYPETVDFSSLIGSITSTR